MLPTGTNTCLTLVSSSSFQELSNKKESLCFMPRDQVSHEVFRPHIDHHHTILKNKNCGSGTLADRYHTFGVSLLTQAQDFPTWSRAQQNGRCGSCAPLEACTGSCKLRLFCSNFDRALSFTPCLCVRRSCAGSSGILQ